MATDNEALIRKLSGFQNVIPQFDNISAISPQFFIENLETITELVKCTDEEKLLIMRSRIRGDALTNVINSPDLNQEKDFKEFKRKFLSYFDTQYSLGARQKQFSNCIMTPNEQVKTYAAKVALATQNFFNSPDLTNEAIKTIFEETKLAKFLDGLLPCYKNSLILKEPKTFQEAVDFAQTLQASEFSPNDNTIDQMVNNISSNSANDEIKAMLAAHASNTHEMINSLTKQIEDLKLRTQAPQQTYNTFRNPGRQGTEPSRFYQNRSFGQRNCSICNRSSHPTSECFYNSNNRQNARGRNSSFRGNGRSNYSYQNTARNFRGNSTRGQYNGNRGSGNR